MPVLRRTDDHHRDFRLLDAAQGTAEYPKPTRKDCIVTRRELPHIPSATALPRRRQPIAANRPPARQKIDDTHQCGVHGKQNLRRTRNKPMSKARGSTRKDAPQTSKNTKSP